jgi:hypothetical protein
MWRFKSRCSEKCFEQIRQTNLPLGSSSWTRAVACFFIVSSSRIRPGPFSIARGFFMPCPPFTNSNCTSAGRPNYFLNKRKEFMVSRDSKESVRIDLVRFGFFSAFIELDFYENSMFFRKARKFRCFLKLKIQFCQKKT